MQIWFLITYLLLHRSPILALLGNRLDLRADSTWIPCQVIGYVDDETYQKYLLDQAERFEHVIVLAGNHEFSIL